MSFQDQSVALPGDGRISLTPGASEGVFDVKFGSDNTTNVHFYRKAVHDAALSAQHGRPMTRGVEYVRIQQPGEKDYTDDPVANKPWARDRFPRQWAQYQRSQAQIPDGTPIDMLFPQRPEVGSNLHG